MMEPVGAADIRKARCLRMSLSIPEGGGAEITWAQAIHAPAEDFVPTEVDEEAAEKQAPRLDFPRPQNRFSKMIQDMERKYATARPLAKRAGPAIKKKVAKKAKAATSVDGTDAEGQAGQGEGDAGDRGVGGGEADEEQGDSDDGSSHSNDSWYDMEDDFIDDSELLDEGVEAEDEAWLDDGAEGGQSSAGLASGPARAPAGPNARVKASGFFISRGDVQSAEQLEASRERQAAMELERQVSKQPRKRSAKPPKATAAAALAPPGADGASNLATGVSVAAGAAGGAVSADGANGARPLPTAPGGGAGGGSVGGDGSGAVRTDCTAWHALHSIARMLGAGDSAAAVGGGGEEILLQRIAEEARRRKVSIKDARLACERLLGLQLRQANTWLMLARSLASKVTIEQASSLGLQDVTTLFTPSGVSDGVKSVPKVPGSDAPPPTAASPSRSPAAVGMRAAAGAAPPTGAVAALADATPPAPAAPAVAPAALPACPAANDTAMAMAGHSSHAGPAATAARPAQRTPSTPASVGPTAPTDAARSPYMPPPYVPLQPHALPPTHVPPAASAAVGASAVPTAASPSSARPMASPSPTKAAPHGTPSSTAAAPPAASAPPPDRPSAPPPSSPSAAVGGPPPAASPMSALPPRLHWLHRAATQPLWRTVSPVSEGSAADVLAASAARAEESLAEVRREITGKLAALAQQAESDPAVAAKGGAAARVRLPPKLLSAILQLVRLSQLDAFARSEGAGGGAPVPVPISSDGIINPKAWMTPELLARLRAPLPFLSEEALRSRLVGLGKTAAAPEQAAAMRHRLYTSHLPQLEAALSQCLPAQLSAYDAAKSGARAETKRKAEELLRLIATAPAEAVGEKLDLHREGKWKAVKVGSYDGTTGTHTLQDVHGGAIEAVPLSGPAAQKWRRHDEPLPIPKFVWPEPASQALLAVCQLQLSACVSRPSRAPTSPHPPALYLPAAAQPALRGPRPPFPCAPRHAVARPCRRWRRTRRTSGRST